MPPKPQWYHRVPEILEQLDAVEIPVLDRSCIEKLFRVGRWQANALLKRFGAFPSGNTFLVVREELVSKLEAIRDGETFSRETKRRQRLGRELDEVSRLQKARAVKVRVSRDEVEKLRGLPEGVTVEAGRFVVEFESVEELVRRLYEVSQSAAKDFYAFEKAIERSPAESSG
jgi:hypothetical protein